MHPGLPRSRRESWPLESGRRPGRRAGPSLSGPAGRVWRWTRARTDSVLVEKGPAVQPEATELPLHEALGVGLSQPHVLTVPELGGRSAARLQIAVEPMRRRSSGRPRRGRAQPRHVDPVSVIGVLREVAFTVGVVGEDRQTASS